MVSRCLAGAWVLGVPWSIGMLGCGPVSESDGGDGMESFEPVASAQQVGLMLRRRPSGPVHVAGSVLAPTAAVALLALIPLVYYARDLRLRTRPGVVVAPDIYLTDETGRALGGDPIPEAASVETAARQGSLLHVRWGAREGWVPASSVRLLAR